jgi:type I restriction enzyme R subunit
MRHLIDTYIGADESTVLSNLDDLSLVELIVERGAAALNALPAGIRGSKQGAAETIENNVRKLILDESPINPKYYEAMSKLLEALIEQRRQDAVSYEAYLEKIVDLTRKAKAGPTGAGYPVSIDTPARRSLYDNVGRDEARALAVDAAVRAVVQDDWRSSTMKTRRVRNAIAAALANPSGVGGTPEPDDTAQAAHVDALLELVKHQHGY